MGGYTVPKEIFLFLGAIVGGVAAYITAKVTGRNQIEIAKLNAERDFRIQENTLFHERIKAEVALKREKLEEVHKILSKMAMENSLTLSYMKSSSEDKDIEKYRKRYLDNCERLHEAIAICDIFFSDMTKKLKDIYSAANIFWGHQENLMRLDIRENKEGWDINLNHVLEQSKRVAELVREAQDELAQKGMELNKALHSDGNSAALHCRR